MGIKKFLADTFNWESIAKVLFLALAELLDMFVVGEELSLKQKKLVRTVDYIGREWGETWVSETDTDIDDDFVDSVLDKAKDTAEEGGFGLVDIPEL